MLSFFSSLGTSTFLSSLSSSSSLSCDVSIGSFPSFFSSVPVPPLATPSAATLPSSPVAAAPPSFFSPVSSFFSPMATSFFAASSMTASTFAAPSVVPPVAEAPVFSSVPSVPSFFSSTTAATAAADAVADAADIAADNADDADDADDAALSAGPRGVFGRPGPGGFFRGLPCFRGAAVPVVIFNFSASTLATCRRKTRSR